MSMFSISYCQRLRTAFPTAVCNYVCIIMIRVIEEFLNFCHFNLMNKLIDGVFVEATI